MQTLKVKKVKILMIILILLIQAVAPLLTVIVENSFTLTTFATTTEWDISATEEDNVKAVFDDETGILIISGTGAMKTWNGSSPWYSERSNIKNIIIEEGVTNIGSYAFSNCNSLISIEIPNSVTSIGRNVFRRCSSLVSIEIPDTVTTIGESAFSKCDSLTSIEIPNSVTSIGRDVFRRCSSLTSIEMPSSIMSIGDYAFYMCSNLTSIEIPDSVTTIGESAFSNCDSLTKIEISSKLTSIGTNTFSCCSNLTSIEVDNNNNYYLSENGILYNKSKTSIICYPAKKAEKEYQIPEGVTAIESSAFSRCSSLISIEIPTTVRNIGDYAFYYCSNLTSIKIPEGVTSINRNTFLFCNSLTNVEIPSSVGSIGEWAFYGCSSLTSIEIPSSVTSIGENAFSYCKSLTTIEIPSSVTSIGEWAFYSCRKLARIEIPSSVTNIEDCTFYECSSLTSIEIPSSVRSIGEWAFYGCSSLTSIEIPSSVTSIGTRAFSHCSSLTSIEIPTSLTNIGAGAFLDCSNLTRIEIPSSVTSIGENAFSNCSSLTIYCKTNSEAENYCETNGLTYIIDDIGPEISVRGNSVEWTEEDITLVITATDLGATIPVGLSEEAYSFDGGETWQVENTKTYTQNTSNIVIKVKDKLENIATYETNITKIDKYDPEISCITGNPTTWIGNDVELTIVANDTESGLAEAGAYSFDGGETWQKENTKTYTENTNNIVIKVRDTVGNIETYETINITKIDKTKPTISNVTGNPTEWTKEDVTLTITATDDGSGLAEKPYSFDGGTTWQAENTKTYTENTNDIVIQVKDRVGNIAEYEEVSITKIMKLESIAITKVPSKTTYIEGETFDKTGMEVTVTYDNGNTEKITDYIVTDGDSLKLGKTEVTISYTVNGITKTVEQEITVKEALKTSFNEYTGIKNEEINYIKGISLNTTIEELSKNITTNGDIIIYNGETEITDNTEKIATGMTIKITLEEQTEEYVTVVTGDVNGDGKANLNDILVINRHRLNKVALEGAYVLAGDVDGNGKADLNDILKLNRYRLGKIDSL